MKKDSAKPKKKKRLIYFVPVITLALLLLALFLTTHRPKEYAPLKIEDQNQVSPYLTNQLMPTVYNRAQLNEPFEVVITQAGLNDIVARSPQPIRLNNIALYDPQVILMPEEIILLATANVKRIDFIAVVELVPAINQNGLLNLHINSIKLGAVNITAIAASIGKKAYSNWLSSTGTDPDNSIAQICRSLLNDEPFDPVFEIGGRTVRLSKIRIAEKTMTVLLTPLSE